MNRLGHFYMLTRQTTSTIMERILSSAWAFYQVTLELDCPADYRMLTYMSAEDQYLMFCKKNLALIQYAKNLSRGFASLSTHMSGERNMVTF
ncbi:hypothetical protein EW026_g2499 [Hermanssonia centrifuga]|uniref:Uncharacterized protein n=1 Tax=Hermanssonia centrifuga TaxID=98765 RepID=A0A4S4KN09_9APHY|nr:hypothetical protein EW026_g2499 [Hermanssonia centrifuga]